MTEVKQKVIAFHRATERILIDAGVAVGMTYAEEDVTTNLLLLKRPDLLVQLRSQILCCSSERTHVMGSIMDSRKWLAASIRTGRPFAFYEDALVREPGKVIAINTSISNDSSDKLAELIQNRLRMVRII